MSNPNCWQKYCAANCCNFNGFCPTQTQSCYYYYQNQVWNGGLIAGVIIACIIFIAIFVCILYFIRRRRQQRQMQQFNRHQINNQHINQHSAQIFPPGGQGYGYPVNQYAYPQGNNLAPNPMNVPPKYV